MAKTSGGLKAAGITERNEWEVEDALRTLTRAEEIKKDPAMMKKVRAMAKEKMARMQSLTVVGGEKK